MSWQTQTRQRLIDSALNNGGWPYQTGRGPSSEPTALACLALGGRPEVDALVRPGLRWLVRQQRSQGGVGTGGAFEGTFWPTSLAILAWNACDSESQEFADSSRRAVQWLLGSEGKAFRSNPAIYGHNTLLKGWSWVEDTHSWIEPTVYAILALRTAGHGGHARVSEAVSLLIDRAIPGGGWNYGNSRMFGNDLRAFPAQTGMVLAALAGEPRGPHIDAAIEFLQGELPHIQTAYSLSWGLIGMSAWDSVPAESAGWLARCAERANQSEAEPLGDALLLLAEAAGSPLWTRKELSSGL